MSQMAQSTFDVLRHVQVHGSRTRKEALKAYPEAVSKQALENLAALGYLTTDGMSKPVAYVLTKKGMEKLAKPFTPAAPRTSGLHTPRTQDTLAMRYRAPATRHGAVYRVRAGNYQPTEYTPSTRPGAMVAFSLPSRFVNTLRWRDGRITDLDGNAVPG